MWSLRSSPSVGRYRPFNCLRTARGGLTTTGHGQPQSAGVIQRQMTSTTEREIGLGRLTAPELGWLHLWAHENQLLIRPMAGTHDVPAGRHCFFISLLRNCCEATDTRQQTSARRIPKLGQNPGDTRPFGTEGCTFDHGLRLSSQYSIIHSLQVSAGM